MTYIISVEGMRMSNEKQKVKMCLIMILSLVIVSLPSFGQSASSLGGTVRDASQAVLPGASITAINVDTGVETRTTANNSGVYNFPSLQPGVYNVTAETAGFQKAAKTDVKLGMGSQLRLNFDMVVAGSTEIVEVTGTAENMILEAGSSTGTVLQEEVLTQLPLISNDVMDLINVMGGVVKSEDPIFSNFQQTFAGVSAGNINVSRDGVSVSEVRWTSGIVSPGRVNQEMVGEFKMVLSPVDAEMGRGAGQVQIMTKSGSNAFRGSGVWNIQNTALDAEEWYLKRSGEKSPWRNLNNYTLSASGPIIRNRTFFFASWDQQIVREKRPVSVAALTNCARLGIYRYFAGWDNLPFLAYNQFVAPQFNNGVITNTPARPVVNIDGTPAYTYKDETSGYEVNQTPSDMRFKSVFGELSPTAIAALNADPINCSAYEQQGLVPSTATPTNNITSPWSATYRNSYDQSGYVEKFNNMVPSANAFNYGDGLNTAGYRWNRTEHGANTVFGTGQDGERKSITFKIDHNINSAHRLSGTYSYDKTAGEDSYPSWPNEYAFGGVIERRPQSFTATLTSTLGPTLLNEIRFGLSRTVARKKDALVANPDKLKQVLHDLMPISDTFPVIVGYDPIGYSPGINWMFNSTSPSHPFGSMGIKDGSWGGVDHRWTASDTITWMRGTHSFKGGFEIRLAKSMQETNGDYATGPLYPAVLGGAMSTSSYNNTEFASWANDGMVGSELFGTGGYGTVRNLLNYFSGSVAELRQAFYANSAKNLTWNNLGAGEMWKISDLRSRELAFFFKDDWKVNNSLTLNMGVRYEYYGVPWEESGMTAALTGGSSSIWGPSGGDFSTWMPTNPGAQYDPSRLAGYQFVGPNSPHSDLGAWNKDMNNFAPHVGFSWQLPWFGQGKTTLRGGYSISYSPITNFDGYAGIIANVPGITYNRVYGGETPGQYITLNDLLTGSYFPLASPDTMTPAVNVLGVKTVDDRRSTISVYDDNIRSPYVQNMNLSLTRSVGNIVTVDVRYIGTLSRKQLGGTNINSANYIRNGLFDEFEIVRNGGESTVLNSLIPANTLWYGATGSEQLRGSMEIDVANFNYTPLNTYLMQGNYAVVASRLATANGIAPAPSGTAGGVLRAGGAPENLIFASPQFASATLNSNLAHSNYHSLQTQVTMRPVRGLSFQTTYTWSRNLTDQGITNYLTGVRRYYLATQHRLHSLSSYGSFDLPIGENGVLFRNASGVFKKAIEGWQISWVASMTSGLPGSVTGASRWWNDSAPVLVRPDLWDSKAGTVTWADGALSGYFFGDRYIRDIDPQCTTIVGAPTTPGGVPTPGSLSEACYGASGMRALYLRNPDGTAGELVMRNALPGEVGNFAPNELTGPGRWSLDMAMSKAVDFMEGKRLELRVDAQNILNHPTPSNQSTRSNARFTSVSNPDFSLNSANPYGFGVLGTKGGHRTFQAKIRISF